jgi:MoaA/NifB/PqqE/SkfB family radical SAM enzyme
VPYPDSQVLRSHETHTLRLEASTFCQLKCPICPTPSGAIKADLGAGFLSFETFRRLVDDHPWIWEIELSNWGEIFLNPEIERIIAYAYRRSVALTAFNGANLNHVKDRVLEAMARYRFRAITCSIDGATQGVYETYRRRGNLDRVLDNIRRLNAYKHRWRTRFPILSWQMIAFDHNAHEIEAARAMAAELGMGFSLKINGDQGYAPLAPGAEATVRSTVAQTRLGVDTLPGEHDDYLTDDYCWQLWRQPQVNHDGRFLGCCTNTWGSFGPNVFDRGLEEVLAAEPLAYAKRMLRGEVPPRHDVPCTNCAIYLRRRRTGRWLAPPPPEPGLRGLLRRHGFGRALVWLVNRRGRWAPLQELVRTR